MQPQPQPQPFSIFDARTQTAQVQRKNDGDNRGMFLHLGLHECPEFWMIDVIRRRYRGTRRQCESVIKRLVEAAEATTTDDTVLIVTVGPAAARQLLRRPNVSDKYVYRAIRRSFVEPHEKATVS